MLIWLKLKKGVLKMDKVNVVIVAKLKDAKRFQKIRSEYKDEGKTAGLLFSEMLDLIEQKLSKQERF